MIRSNRTLGRVGMVHFAVDPFSVSDDYPFGGEADSVFAVQSGSTSWGLGILLTRVGIGSAYLWERVWSRDAWLDILGRFIHVERPSRGSRARPTVIFPRFHQWDAVRRLEADAKAERCGS